MIKYLLTKLGRAGWENVWFSVMVHGPRCARSVRHDLEPNIFPSPAPPPPPPFSQEVHITITIITFANMKSLLQEGPCRTCSYCSNLRLVNCIRVI